MLREQHQHSLNVALSPGWGRLIRHGHLQSLLLLLTILACQPAVASKFYFPFFGEDVAVVGNTAFIAGAAFRVEDRNKDLVSKIHLNPELCGRPNGKLYYQSCQGIFLDQVFTAERLVNAPGYASSNFDQGNLNYDKWDVTQSGLRINQDFTFSWKNFGLFVKGFAFWDPVNNDFKEDYRNIITRENLSRVGYTSFPGDEIIRVGGLESNLGLLGPLLGGLGLNGFLLGDLLANPLGIPVLGARNDSQPCPAERNPNNQPCGIVYGPGGRERLKRRDKTTLDQIGKNLILQDLNLFGSVATPWESELFFKVGKQQVNWGESTIQFFDSLNIANPADLNNLFRLGGNGLDDFYTPINMISLSTNIAEGLQLSGFYQLEWKPLAAPAAGGFHSPLNANTENGGPDYVTIGFGQFAHDPEGLGNVLDSPLTAISATTSRIQRLPDREPDDGGQFGVQLRYYADWLNNGTDLSLYYANYHSRTPMVSAYSADISCGKAATDPASLAILCPDIPLLHALTNPNSPDTARDDLVALDTIKVLLEYPEDIEMFGFSLNTTIGEVAVQGEVAYRPDEPLQVALVDVAFAAAGPLLTNCHLNTGCVGSNSGLGVMPDGSIGTYGSSDFRVGPNEPQSARFPDTFDAVVGHMPSVGRSFPNFIVPYRGGTIGLNPANSYIQGWEPFDTFSFNIGATYLEGSTDFGPKLLRADQIVWLFEVGARWVPDIPELDELQLEAPGIQYHASAGADGSGANRSRQACSTNKACSYGPDGLRFNPHQQDPELYPDEWSAGYSIVSLIRYESILPGISLQPQIIFKHDIYNTSPGLASNFIEDRVLLDAGLEIRYLSNFSVNLGYQHFSGGGVANQLNDRDNARVFIKYAF